MKKSLICFAMIAMILTIFLAGCEQSTQLNTASIREITSAGSDNYGVRISYAEDKRLEGKGTDVQIKFDKRGTITIWQENQNKFDYTITDIDEWFSMTDIFAEANLGEGESKNVKFEKIEEALTKVYLFNYDGKINITFRVVVGEIDESSDGNGEILVGSEPISDQFTLKI